MLDLSTTSATPSSPTPDAVASVPAPRLCAWCGEPIPAARSKRFAYCTTACSTEATRTQRDARFSDYWAKNQSFHTWNARLLRAKVPKNARHEALAPLRGLGKLSPAEVQRRVYAGGWLLLAHNQVERVLAGAPLPAEATPADTTPEPAAPATERPVAVPTLDPWTLPSPEGAHHLVHALAMTLDPTPRPGITLRITRLLHGALSAATKLRHQRRGNWSLTPHGEGCGWAVLFFDADVATALRATTHNVKIGATPHRLTFGAALHHLRAPAPRPAGRYHVTVTTQTPVSWSGHDHAQATTDPTVATVCASLERVARIVLGTQRVTRAHMGVEHLAHTLTPERVHVGGHWGRGPHPETILAVTGTVTLVGNAVLAWLLECAAWTGLGGATSIGLGRVTVAVEPLS